MKSFAKAILDKTLIRFIVYVSKRTVPLEPRRWTTPYLDVLTVTHNNAVQDSALYVEEKMARAIPFHEKSGVRDHVVRQIKFEGMCLEFGV